MSNRILVVSSIHKEQKNGLALIYRLILSPAITSDFEHFNSIAGKLSLLDFIKMLAIMPPLSVLKRFRYLLSHFKAIEEKSFFYDEIILLGPEYILAPLFVSERTLSKTTHYMVDATSLFFERRSKYTFNLVKKALFRIDSFLWKKTERKFVHLFHRVILVSDFDRLYLSKFSDVGNVHVVVNGTKTLPPRDFTTPLNKRYVFWGDFSYSPNRDAIKFLDDEIIPVLKKNNFPFVIHLIGINSERLHFIRNMDSFIVIGYVSEINKFVSPGDVFICPLRYGAGVKNKVIEAMMLSMPLIISPVAAEGLVLPSENIIPTDVDQWVKAIMNIDDDSIGRIAKKNYKAALEMYSLECSIKRLKEVMKN